MAQVMEQGAPAQEMGQEAGWRFPTPKRGPTHGSACGCSSLSSGGAWPPPSKGYIQALAAELSVVGALGAGGLCEAPFALSQSGAGTGGYSIGGTEGNVGSQKYCQT